MDEQIKSIRKSVLDEEYKSNPALPAIRRRVVVLLAVFVAVRALFSIYETAFVLSRGASLGGCVINYILLLLGALFAYAVYNGARSLSYLLMLGSAVSLLISFGNGSVIAYLSKGDIAYNIYAAILAASALFQAALFAYFAFAKSLAPYFAAADKANAAVFHAKSK